MSLIAGIDFSSMAIDTVLLDEDTNDAVHHRRQLDVGHAKLHDRVRRVRDALPTRGAWKDSGVLVVAIEEPFNHSPNGLTPLLLTLGAILGTLPRDIPLALLRADDWRRQCGLPTRAPGGRPEHKQNAIAFARRQWDNPPIRLDDNAADAFCIAWAARELHRAREEQRRAA